MRHTRNRTGIVNAGQNRGFTLMELAIVMAVIAILAAIAIPSYRDFVLRSNRAEARAALEQLASLQQEYYSNQLAYTGTIAYLNYPVTTPNGLYQLAISTNTSVGYTLQATAIGTQVEDTTCSLFTLNGVSLRAAQATGGSDTTEECWDHR